MRSLCATAIFFVSTFTVAAEPVATNGSSASGPQAYLKMPVPTGTAMVSMPTTNNCVGDTFKVWDRSSYVLYLRRACNMPIDSAKNMHYLELRSGEPNYFFTGCWGRSLNGDVITLLSDETTNRLPSSLFVRSEISSDGTGKILAVSEVTNPKMCSQ